MKVFALLMLLGLAGCAGRTASSPPAGTFADPGFTAFCAAHPHQGTCP